jgi:hypothetical protein
MSSRYGPCNYEYGDCSSDVCIFLILLKSIARIHIFLPEIDNVFDYNPLGALYFFFLERRMTNI